MGEPNESSPVMVEEPFLDAERILAVLNLRRVDYVVIGALGATFHGSPLRTEDIDICARWDPDNLDRLAAALVDLKAKEWDPRKDEFFDRPWSGEMLGADCLWLLLTEYGPLDVTRRPAAFAGYEELVRSAVELEIDGLRVTVASLEDIIRSKETLGREKDRAQLPALRRLLERIEERGSEG